MYFIWYKNGLVALPTCVVNPGENVLLPDPGYTDYLAGVMLADANPVPLNLDPPDYLPNWDNVDKRVLDNTTLVYLTYPNNPTGSTATKEVFDEAIERFKGTKTKLCTTLLIVLLALMLKIQAYLLQNTVKMSLLKFSHFQKDIICQVSEWVLQ